MERRHDDSDSYYERRIDSGLTELLGSLSRGDDGAADEALAFLW